MRISLSWGGRNHGKRSNSSRPTFEKIVEILSRTATTFILVDKHRGLLLEIWLVGITPARTSTVTRCRPCQKKGPWAAECASKKSTGGVIAFAYCSAKADISRSIFTFLIINKIRQVIYQIFYKENRIGDGGWAFLTIAGDEAILDIGVTHNLTGLPILEDLTKELKKVGLQPVKIDSPFFLPEPIVFRRVYGTWDLLVYHVTIAAPYPGGIDPRLAVYARSWDGHYTTTRRDRLCENR